MRHKFIGYIFNSISFLVVFYYFSISYSRGIKNKYKVFDIFDKTTKPKVEERCVTKDMGSSIHKIYPFKLTTNVTEDILLKVGNILKTSDKLLMKYFNRRTSLEIKCNLDSMKTLLKKN